MSTPAPLPAFWLLCGPAGRRADAGLNERPAPASNVHAMDRTQRNAGDDDMDKLTDAMHGADFVLIDGVVFEAAYLRVPDEFTVADDVVIEATRGSDEVAFTRGDVDGAEALGEGVYRLKSGSLLQFLSSATVH